MFPALIPALLMLGTFGLERVENALGFQRWYMDRMFIIAPAGAYVGKWLQSFREFPPRQKPGSFNLDRVMESVTRGSRGGRPITSRNSSSSMKLSACRRNSSAIIGGWLRIVDTTETRTPCRCRLSTSGRKSPSPENSTM